MKAALDLPGSLKYLALRALPFVSQAWAVHRSSGLQFRVHLRDGVGRTILRRQGYEVKLTAWLLSALACGKPGLFIDVGANIGWFSLHAARQPNVLRVLAVEPEAQNRALLQINIDRNGLQEKVQAVACALGAEAGTARLSRYKGSNRGRHSLIADHGLGGSQVPVRALDELLRSMNDSGLPISGMKVDVEGYEPLVLMGARAALSTTRTLLVELSPDLSRAGGLDLAGALGLIEAAGFHPEIWDKDGSPPGFEKLRAWPEQVTVGFGR